MILLFDGIQTLDVAGPADVFTMANELAETAPYTVEFVSSRGGLIRATNGLKCDTTTVSQVPVASIDTLIIAGGRRDSIINVIRDKELRAWVTKAAPQVRRLATVCSGIFVLAQWRLIEGRRVTTHWSAGELLRKHYPGLQVDADALYIEDGHVWSSGGVTAGIDMCLAMLEADQGRWLTTRVAQQMVLSARRVGNQAQYSAELTAQAGGYARLVDWIRANLSKSLDLPLLAARAGETERTFCRRFKTQTSMTPARFVELLRLESARHRLEGGASVLAAARGAGFASSEHLSRVFRRRLNMSPLEYRQVHYREHRQNDKRVVSMGSARR